MRGIEQVLRSVGFVAVVGGGEFVARLRNRDGAYRARVVARLRAGVDVTTAAGTRAYLVPTVLPAEPDVVETGVNFTLSHTPPGPDHQLEVDEDPGLSSHHEVLLGGAPEADDAAFRAVFTWSFHPAVPLERQLDELRTMVQRAGQPPPLLRR